MTIPVLEDVESRRRELRRAAKKRYRERSRFSVVAPRLGIEKPTTFSHLTILKRHVERYLSLYYPEVDRDEVMRELEARYRQWRNAS